LPRKIASKGRHDKHRDGENKKIVIAYLSSPGYVHFPFNCIALYTHCLSRCYRYVDSPFYSYLNILVQSNAAIWFKNNKKIPKAEIIKKKPVGCDTTSTEMA
jgi:hypothetical protein